MKNCFSIALLVVLTYLFVGHYAAFEYGNYHAYRLFRQTAKHSKQLVAISKAAVNADKNIDWEEQDEFRYQGRMYDVVREDAQFYYCLDDNYETGLYENLANSIIPETDIVIHKVIQMPLFIKDCVMPAKKGITAISFIVIHFPSFVSPLPRPYFSLLKAPPKKETA